MSHITISRHHRRVGNWAARIPVTAIAREYEKDGIKVIATHRDYWIDTSLGNKLRYQTMTADKSSAAYYVDLYVEIKPGLFFGGHVATDSNEDYKSARLVETASRLSQIEISELASSLTHVN